MKTCLECEESLPEASFSPRGYSPSGEVAKRAPRCKPCTSLIQNWDRERKRRMDWLERSGLGPSAYETQAAQVDQKLPPSPKAPKAMPVMPESYFSQRGKRGPGKKRVLTAAEEAAKMEREERLQKTKAYQDALKARLKRDSLLLSIRHAEWYLSYVEEHVSKHGCYHHCLPCPETGEPRRLPWRVCTEPLEVLRPRTAERLEKLKEELEVTPEVDLPSLEAA